MAELARRRFLQGAAVLSGAAAIGLPGGSAHAATDSLWSFDLTYVDDLDLTDPAQAATACDHMQVVACIQGIVNRSGAALFVDFVQGDEFGELRIDQYWLGKLRRPGEWLAGRQIHTVPDLDHLVRQFRGRLGGAVVWDPAVPATANVAATIAGVEDLVVIRYDTSPDSLYSRYVAGSAPLLPARRSLLGMFTGTGTIAGTTRKSTGSAKCDAYIWALAHYLNRCTPGELGFYLDGYWLGHADKLNYPHRVQNALVLNHDYLISRRGFFFDLSPWADETPVDDPDQPLGTDLATLHEILLGAYRRTGGAMTAIHGFVPWAFKYTTSGGAGKHDGVPTEWEFVRHASAYNGYLDADAEGLDPMANASLFAHYPLAKRYPQQPAPTVAQLKERGLLNDDGTVAAKRFVMFYVGDYDSAAWIYHAMPRLWDDQGRGSVPLNWAFNPNLESRIGPALVYARQTATAADTFIAGDSGAGYLNPGMLQEPREFSGLPSGYPAWRRHCTPYFRRWDLSVTGFVIDGYAPGMNADGLRTYAEFSTDGFAAQKIDPSGVVGRTPYVRMGPDLPRGPATDAATALQNALSGDLSQPPAQPEFHSVRTILMSATWHRQVVDAVAQAIPDAGVTVVDALTFYALVRQQAT